MSYAKRDATDNPAEASGRARHLAPNPRSRLSRRLLATVPVVLVGSIAVSIGMASPAQAQPHPKRPSKAGDDRRADARKPASKTAGSKAERAPRLYTVVESDTVSAIAARFSLSTASVLALNGLSWKSFIFPGQVLQLTDAVPSQATHAPAAIKHHVVVAGDTISGIAAANDLSTGAVLSANGLDGSSIIYPGQSIALPETAEISRSATVTSSSDAEALVGEMITNAKTIIAVGRRAGVSDYGLIVAIAAAMQESGLRNLDHGDEDSLGLFQQRPSTGWGTADQIMSPEHAARAFFGGPGNPNADTRGLLDIPGWESMPVTKAAQAVQISAYSDAYAAWEPLARKIVAQLG